MVSNVMLYQLADALGMDLEVDGNKIRGKTTRKVELGSLTIETPLKIVASAVAPGAVALLCRAIGDLGIVGMYDVPSASIGIMLIDLDKAGEGLERAFEKEITRAGIYALVKPCLVRCFERPANGGPWARVS